MGCTLAAVLALAGLTTAPPAAAQGVRVAILPASQTVTPGSEFDLFLEVTQAGSAFNAFEAIVGYDPAALTLIQLSPLSLQEGPLLTNACTNRFHRFRRGADRDTITDVLLCSGVTVTGPGRIYKLRFRASTTSQVTRVRFLPGLKFFDAGVAVTPVISSDADVGIGVTLAVDPGAGAPGPTILAAPNPARARATFHLGGRLGEGAVVEVLDPMGRLIRRLRASGGPSAALVWDGRDARGRRAPPGAYTARLVDGEGSVQTRFVLIH